MYARVARWDGGDAEAIRANAEDIKSRAAEGPPEGVPSTGVTFLADPEGGRMMVIGLFETEEDLRAGDEVLNSMSPPQPMGTRAPIEVYEVAFEVRM